MFTSSLRPSPRLTETPNPEIALPMKIEIQTAQNGWLIEVLEPEDERRLYVFSEDEETEASTAQAFVQVLHTLKDLIGPSESRYSEHRVRITIEPGDKWEPPAPEEPSS